jgi:hypothetical protein
MVLLACALIQEPRLTVGATQREVEIRGAKKPGFHCEGTARLPDGARITLELYWHHFEAGMDLSSRTTLVKEARFELDLAFFDEQTFPGLYVIRARLNSVNQPQEVVAALDPDERPEAQIELRVGTPEDEARARRAFFDELEALIVHFESICSRIVESEIDEAAGTKALAEKTDPFSLRKEVRLLRLGDLAHDVFGPMSRWVARVAQLRKKDKAEAAAELGRVKEWTEKVRRRLLHGDTTESNRRAGELIAAIEAKLDADVSAELLELGALLPPQAGPTLQALAEALQAGRKADAQQRAKELRRWLSP